RIVGNFAAELFLERHDELDGIERISAEIVDEARPLGDLVGLDTQMFHDDLLPPVANVTHLINLVRFETGLAGRDDPRSPRGASWLSGRAKMRARETRMAPAPRQPCRP